MADKKIGRASFREEFEVEKMLFEMCNDTMRSQHHMASFCIKESYSKTSKKTLLVLHTPSIVVYVLLVF